MARAVENAFERSIPRRAYEVVIGPNGDLNWIKQTGARTITHRTEPRTNGSQRIGIRILSHMPVEWLL